MENTAVFTSGGAAFTTTGITPGREIGNVGAGLTFVDNKAWSIEGIYDYQWSGSGYENNQAMAKFVIHL